MTQNDVGEFRRILNHKDPDSTTGTIGVLTENLDKYNVDWQRKFKGQSTLVLRPKTVYEVSEVLSHCNRRKLAVVPQGGNTGLVGGGVPVHNEIVISTELMNKVIEVDAVNGVIVTQSGAVLQTLDEELAKINRMMPIDLGAKGSCQIGGNVSTNAGGSRVMRYGSLRESVLGLQVVLPDGSIIDNLNKMRKDNTGYDINQLFIGAEGTLGIVTAVSMQVPHRPSSINLALLAFQNYDDVLDVVTMAKSDLGEIISAVEFVDSSGMALSQAHTNWIGGPLDKFYPMYMLLETAGNRPDHDTVKLNEFIERALVQGAVTDGVVAQDKKQLARIWKLRESIPEALQMADVYVYKYDVSLPLQNFYEIVDELRANLWCRCSNTANGDTQQTVGVTGYGHLGDGNLHINVSIPTGLMTPDEANAFMSDAVDPFVYQWVSERRGSVSAEHGIGRLKRDYLPHSKSAASIALMQTIKHAIDPKGIMNPYKLLK